MPKQPLSHQLNIIPLIIIANSLIIILVVGINGLNHPGQAAPVQVKPIVAQAPTPSSSPTPTSIPQPAPNLTASAYLVKDSTRNQTILEHNAQQPLAQASTTKIMTAVISLETYQLDQLLTVDHATAIGSQIKLAAGERISMQNLLYGLLLASGNDAAEVLAENHPNGRADFVTAMNQKAEYVGLKNTHFTNPSGLDDPDHYSSAQDLVRLGEYAMQNPHFKRIVSTYEAEIFNADRTIVHSLVNKNELLANIPGVNGIKTGWTDLAGEVLVTSVERDHLQVTIAILGSQNRFADTTQLIDWAYQVIPSIDNAGG
jgi:D-alanyl-D-alanine carboxypeptidase